MRSPSITTHEEFGIKIAYDNAAGHPAIGVQFDDGVLPTDFSSPWV